MTIDRWLRKPDGEVDYAILFDGQVIAQGGFAVIRLEYIDELPALDTISAQIAMMPEDAKAIGNALIEAADIALKNKKQRGH